MVAAGADVDRPNPDGMTPMIMALDNGAPTVARYLLDHGANPPPRAWAGRPARARLRPAPRPHAWAWWGRTPLYVAVTMRGGRDSRPGRRPPESLAFIN